MASKQSGAGGSGDVNPKLEFKFLEDELSRVFTLIIDSRMPAYHQNLALEPIASDYRLLVPRTIVKWSKVMWAYLTNTEISKEDDVSVLSMPILRDGKEIVLEPSQFDPYVTVWNLSISNAPKIFMNTRDLPSDVLALAREHVLGVSDFYRYSSKFGMVRIGVAETYGQSSVTPDTPANVTPSPPRATSQQTQPQGNSKAFPYDDNSQTWIKRSIWLAGTKTHIQLQKGKLEDGKFEKPAMVVTERIDDWESLQFDDNQLIALRISPQLPIKAVATKNGSLKIDIPTENTRYPYSVWVGFEDKDYEFKTLRDILGIPKERETEIEDGMAIHLDDECYLVLKCSSTDKDGNQYMKKGKPVQYKSLYNIYYAPSS